MKQNNKGFSLVEIIIAAAVFVIIAVPVINGFVSAVATSGNAKVKMQATSAAQNIMEELVITSISDVVADDVNWEAWNRDASGNLVAATNRTEADLFIKKDATGIDMGGNTFDARITLDSTGYDYDPSTFSSPADVPKTSNSHDVVSVENINYKCDAYYVDEKDVTASIVPASGATVESTFRNMGVSETQLALGFDRIIQIDVVTSGTIPSESDPTINVNCPKVDVTYIYKCGTKEVIMDDSEVFNSLNTKEQLRNMYLFFKTPDNVKQDTIQFNNLENFPVTLYLVKQDGENNDVTVEIRENNPQGYTNWDTDSTFVADTKLRSNFGWFISEDDTDNSLIVYYKRKNRIIRSNNPVSFNKAKLEQALKCSNYIGTGLYDRMYEVKIEIFKHQSETSNQFKEADRLFTLSGTKEN